MTTRVEDFVDAMVADKELIFRFFAVFSRFEYALKRSKTRLKDGDATADWDAYGGELRGRFASVPAQTFQDACTYLKSEPPKKQVIENGVLKWKNTYEGNVRFTENDVLILVRRVRNNLFHGGKYPSGPVVDDMERNNKLVRCALTVLETCLELSPEVAHMFWEKA